MKDLNFSNSKTFFYILDLIKKTNYHIALSEINKLEKLNEIPNSITKLKCSLYLHKKDWKNIIKLQKDLKLINEDKSNIQNIIGLAYFNLGDYQKSILEFKKSLEYDPKNLKSIENLGLAYKFLGNYKKSTKYFMDAFNSNEFNIQSSQNLINNLNYYYPQNIEENKIFKINNLLHEEGKIADKYDHKNFTKYFSLINESEKILKKMNIKLIYYETQIFRRNKYDLNCSRHLKLFNSNKIIPKFCFNCFKVQITMKNVSDLIRLYFYFNKIKLEKNNLRKCIIELRTDVSGNYKGYIFCDTLHDAKIIKEKIMNDLININLIYKKLEIKHGCTEYYSVFPEFKNYDVYSIYKDNWKIIEKKFDEENFIKLKKKERIFCKTLNHYNLSDFLIIKNWLNYANIIGDDSKISYSEFEFEYSFLNALLKNQIEFRKKDLIN